MTQETANKLSVGRYLNTHPELKTNEQTVRLKCIIYRVLSAKMQINPDNNSSLAYLIKTSYDSALSQLQKYLPPEEVEKILETAKSNPLHLRWRV